MQAIVSEQTVPQTNAGWKLRASLTQEDWDSHLPFFRELYLKEQRTLEDVMRLMEEKLGFIATKKMYKTNFKRLRLFKNRTKTTDEINSMATTETSKVPLTESTRAWNALIERTSGMAMVPIAGHHALKRPMRSLSSAGVNSCAEALLWHVAVHSESWLEARNNSPLLFTQTSRTWDMLMGHSAVSFSLFDMRQGLGALDQACAVVNKVMSQGSNNLLPVMLVEFCSKWWSHFPGLRHCLLRYLTKLAATRLGTQHPLTIILFHLMDEKVASVSIDAALQIVTQAAEREPPLLDHSALSLRHAYCCMLIDCEQYQAALAPMEWLRDEALKLYGHAGVLTRCSLLRKGEIHIGLGAIEDARLSYEEALQLSEGQHGHTDLDAIGIEAVTRLASLHLTSGDAAGAQKLCKKALRNMLTPFSTPGLRGMGLTLKVMLEEMLLAANHVLGVHEHQKMHFTSPLSDGHPEDHDCQTPKLGAIASHSSHDYIAIRASLKGSAGCSISDAPQTEPKTGLEECGDEKDPLIMNHNHIVRWNAICGGGGGGGRPPMTRAFSPPR